MRQRGLWFDEYLEELHVLVEEALAHSSQDSVPPTTRNRREPLGSERCPLHSLVTPIDGFENIIGCTVYFRTGLKVLPSPGRGSPVDAPSPPASTASRSWLDEKSTDKLLSRLWVKLWPVPRDRSLAGAAGFGLWQQCKEEEDEARGGRK